MSTLNTLSPTAEVERAILAWGDFVTDLDPQLFWAYALGGLLPTVASEPETISRALALLEKGARNNGDGRLFVYLAYGYLTLKHDEAAAGDAAQRGIGKRHAPPYLGALATRLEASGGQFEKARALAQTLIDNAADEATRKFFEERKRTIEEHETLDFVKRAAAEYVRAGGSPSFSLDDLARAGLLAGAPIEPVSALVAVDGGVPFLLAPVESIRPFAQ